MKEKYSLCLLKPDCLERGLSKWVLEKITGAGLEVVLSKEFTFTPELVDAFYPQCRSEIYYEGLKTHLCSGKCLVYVVKGSDAIDRLNTLVGFNDPALSKPNTIRARGENIRCNLAHSSENLDQLFREIVVVFSKQEAMNLLFGIKAE